MCTHELIHNEPGRQEEYLQIVAGVLLQAGRVGRGSLDRRPVLVAVEEHPDRVHLGPGRGRGTPCTRAARASTSRPTTSPRCGRRSVCSCARTGTTAGSCRRRSRPFDDRSIAWLPRPTPPSATSTSRSSMPTRTCRSRRTSGSSAHRRGSRTARRGSSTGTDGDWWVFDDGKAAQPLGLTASRRPLGGGVPPRRRAPRRAAARHVRAQAPPRRSRRRRHLRAGAVPERHARGRQDVLATTATSRCSACAPTTSGSPSSARVAQAGCSRRRSCRPPASTTRSKSSSGRSSTSTAAW